MNYQDWLIAHTVAIQVTAFYGLTAFLAVVETWRPMSLLPANRKRRWVTNFGLTLLAVFLLRSLPLSGLGVSAWAASNGFGLLNRFALPAAAVLALTMATRSLASWALHISMHKVPLLWRIHRTHHLDRVMDVSTTVRFHPIEILLSLGTGTLATCLLGLPVWALLTYEPIESAVRIFSHANLRVPEKVDRVLRFFISTPAMHRIHHSVFQPETDSNYGSIFSFWDRLFGTYTSPDGKNLAGMPLGLVAGKKANVQSFWWLVANPFLRAGGSAKASRGNVSYR
jgi:sterol desaturase/sphingolipid hydroxylase (fatty acid hydroxylase superfamily)